MANEAKPLSVLAIGGNSLIRDEAHRTVGDQYEAAHVTCELIAQLVQRGHRVVITHGNGPQVGFILRRSELSAHELHTVPLDSCGADTQGAIGYHLQQNMGNAMRGWAKPVPVATVVTQVLVDQHSTAFQNPTKPIGSFMSADTAAEHRDRDGWSVVEDAGRGFRRVVPSPRPEAIVELDAIKTLIDAGYIVVAVGGGGIPVARHEDGTLFGVEAVIDKDLASSLLAAELRADNLIISTAVEQAFVHFGKPEQRALGTITVAEARQYLAEGHFKPGSMKPKIEAMIEFVEGTGGTAILTDPEHLVDAADGKTGTRIVP